MHLQVGQSAKYKILINDESNVHMLHTTAGAMFIF